MNTINDQPPPQTIEDAEAAAVERMSQALRRHGRDITHEMERLVNITWLFTTGLILFSLIFQTQILILIKTTLPSESAKCLCSHSSPSPFTVTITSLGLFVDMYPYLYDAVLFIRFLISDHLFLPLPPPLNQPPAEFVLLYFVLFFLGSSFIDVAWVFVCSSAV